MTTSKVDRSKRGYTKADLKTVSDNPEWTKEDFARARPFSEVFPDLHASIKRSRGRPKVENPKEAVTLRLSPDTIEKFKATGDDWRARMARRLSGRKCDWRQKPIVSATAAVTGSFRQTSVRQFE